MNTVQQSPDLSSHSSQNRLLSAWLQAQWQPDRLMFKKKVRCFAKCLCKGDTESHTGLQCKSHSVPVLYQQSLWGLKVQHSNRSSRLLTLHDCSPSQRHELELLHNHIVANRCVLQGRILQDNILLLHTSSWWDWCSEGRWTNQSKLYGHAKWRSIADIMLVRTPNSSVPVLHVTMKSAGRQTSKIVFWQGVVQKLVPMSMHSDYRSHAGKREKWHHDEIHVVCQDACWNNKVSARIKEWSSQSQTCDSTFAGLVLALRLNMLTL